MHINELIFRSRGTQKKCIFSNYYDDDLGERGSSISPEPGSLLVPSPLSRPGPEMRQALVAVPPFLLVPSPLSTLT